MRTRYRLLVWTTLIVAGGSLSARAQQGPDKEGAPVTMGTSAMWMAGGDEPEQVVGFAFGADGLDAEVVKRAPYAAEAVTEFVQTLGDGNRITRKTTASVYRDGQGRTRREQNFGAIAPLSGGGEARQQVLISDPVARTSYVLDPRSKTAQKLELPRFIAAKGDPTTRREKLEAAPVRERAPGPALAASGVGPAGVAKGRPDTFTMAIPPPDVAPFPPPGIAKFGIIEERTVLEGNPESLGKQTIEGVEAEGTRTAVTIAAGEIGNEQPLQIVTERWYAPELQTVVLSRHSDPRFGETTYRLTSIVRGEPDRALFEVPADYKIKSEPPLQDFVFKRVEKRKTKE
jgi:hypothetical protein